MHDNEVSVALALALALSSKPTPVFVQRDVGMTPAPIVRYVQPRPPMVIYHQPVQIYRPVQQSYVLPSFGRVTAPAYCAPGRG